MARCYVCDKETEDRFLFIHFSFEAHLGEKKIQLKAHWVDDKEKDIPICQRCCANLLENFGKGLVESLPGELKFIT